MKLDQVMQMLEAIGTMSEDDLDTNVRKVGIATKPDGRFFVELDLDEQEKQREEAPRERPKPVPTGEGPPPELVPGGIRGMARGPENRS